MLFAVVSQKARPEGVTADVRQREGWIFVWVDDLIASLTRGPLQIHPHGHERRGFVVGSGLTTFKFGTKKATAVSCASTSECAITAPAHEAGTADVRATTNKVTSHKTSADLFTYT